MLYRINERPFFDFEALGGFGMDFGRIANEAQNLMVYSSNHFPSCNSGLEPQPGTLRFEDIVHSPVDQELMASMGVNERHRYNKVVKGMYCPWVVYPLNEFRSWPERQDVRKEWFPEARKYMPYFIEMLEKVSVVAQLGWARIYANEAFNAVELHRDFSPNIKVDQFLYFNLSGKKTFLWDGETKQKVYLDAKCLFFDAANVHGTDPEPRFNFSMRVDCIFEKEFLKSLEFSRASAREPSEDRARANAV